MNETAFQMKENQEKAKREKADRKKADQEKTDREKTGSEEVYREEGSRKYLRKKLSVDQEKGYIFRMLTENQIAGLLPVRLVREGSSLFAEYDISGMAVLTQETSERSGLELVYAVVSQLDVLCSTLKSFMLTSNALSLQPEHIFLKMETGQVMFIYFPEEERTVSEGLKDIMEFFLRRLDPASEKEMLLLYSLYQKSRGVNVTTGVLLELWQSYREDTGHPENSVLMTDRAEELIDTNEFYEEEDPWCEELGLEKKPKRKAFSVEQESLNPRSDFSELPASMRSDESGDDRNDYYVETGEKKGESILFQKYNYEICLLAVTILLAAAILFM